VLERERERERERIENVELRGKVPTMILLQPIITIILGEPWERGIEVMAKQDILRTPNINLGENGARPRFHYLEYENLLSEYHSQNLKQKSRRIQLLIDQNLNQYV